MKMLMTVVLTFVLSLAVAAWAQDNTQSSGSQAQQGQQGQQNSQMGQNQGNQQMSGTVTKNGKNFKDDQNNQSYKIDNPDALQGHEGQHVALVVQVDPTTNTIHVMHILVPDQQ